MQRGLTERLTPVAHSTAQHATQHVLAALVAGARAVGNRKAQRADVVGHLQWQGQGSRTQGEEGDAVSTEQAGQEGRRH